MAVARAAFATSHSKLGSFSDYLFSGGKDTVKVDMEACKHVCHSQNDVIMHPLVPANPQENLYAGNDHEANFKSLSA